MLKKARGRSVSPAEIGNVRIRAASTARMLEKRFVSPASQTLSRHSGVKVTEITLSQVTPTGLDHSEPSPSPP